MGAFKTTPTVAMGALFNIVSPNFTVESLSMRMAIRLHFDELWSMTRMGHASILRDRNFEEFLALRGDYGSRRH